MDRILRIINEEDKENLGNSINMFKENQTQKIHSIKKSQIFVPKQRSYKKKKTNLPSVHGYNLRSLGPITNDIHVIPIIMKQSLFTRNSDSTYKIEDEVNKGMSNNNSYSNRCKKIKTKIDQNCSEIVKDNRIAHNFHSNSSSNEKTRDDKNELENELTELRRLPPRQKCINVNNVSKTCKFFIENLKNCQSNTNVPANHMPHDFDLNYINRMENEFKSVYEPKRSLFYKKLVKTPKNFQVFNLEEGYMNVIADNGMVNLYVALKSFEEKHNYSIKFVKSKLGDSLRRYTDNPDICWDMVHLESNSEEDLLKYRLCYGAIPSKYIMELEMIVIRLLLNKLCDKSKNVQQLLYDDYDLLEGELELMIFNYWQISTRDMFGYKEHLSRKKQKMVFYYMYTKLETNIIDYDFGVNEHSRHKFMNILKRLKSYAAFDKPKVLTAAGLLFMKNAACKLAPFLGKEYVLWSIFFHKLNLHSVAFEFTIKALFDEREDVFQYIITRVLEIDQFNVSGSSKSLWYHGVVQKVNPFNLEDTIISKLDIVNCLSYYFSKPTHVPRSLCIKFDNYYFLYIDLFVSFVINNNLHKYHKILTIDNCKHFFILNDRKYHDFYMANFIPSFETKRMVTSMVTMVNNLLNARLDGELAWSMKIGPDVIESFFLLVHLHLNYTLTPAMLREGPALTDVEWASIFISDLNEMEKFYLGGLRWEDKPCILGGAPDDFDYIPETEDSDLLEDVCSVELASGDVNENNNDKSKKFESSSDEEVTDFNSDDSEDENIDSVIHKILLEKKNKRLLAECKYLQQGTDQHEIFNRKISKIIQDRIDRVGYFSKLKPKKQ